MRPVRPWGRGRGRVDRDVLERFLGRCGRVRAEQALAVEEDVPGFLVHMLRLVAVDALRAGCRRARCLGQTVRAQRLCRFQLLTREQQQLVAEGHPRQRRQRLEQRIDPATRGEREVETRRQFSTGKEKSGAHAGGISGRRGDVGTASNLTSRFHRSPAPRSCPCARSG